MQVIKGSLSLSHKENAMNTPSLSERGHFPCIASAAGRILVGGKYGYLILLLLSFFCPFAGRAAQLRGGLHAGLNFTDLVGRGYIQYEPKPRPGFSGGITAEHGITRMFSLQYRFSYTQMRSRLIDEQGVSEAVLDSNRLARGERVFSNQNYTISSADLLMLPTFTLDISNSLLLGIHLGLGMRRRLLIRRLDENYGSSIESYSWSKFKKWDFLIVGGFRTLVRVGQRGRVFLDNSLLVGTQQLDDSGRNEKYLTYPESKTFTYQAQIGFNYLFWAGKRSR